MRTFQSELRQAGKSAKRLSRQEPFGDLRTRDSRLGKGTEADEEDPDLIVREGEGPAGQPAALVTQAWASLALTQGRATAPSPPVSM